MATAKKVKRKKISKSSTRRRNRNIRQGILLTVLVAFIVGLAFALNFVYGIIKSTAEFDPEKILRYDPFTIVDANDEIIYTYGVEPVLYEEIPEVMVDAIVAVEDSRYFVHNGFDIPRIIKAAIGNAMGGGISSGASTITQQTIKKNYFPDEERTYQRKIAEIFLAIQADDQMDKETILTCYLNTVFFGVGLRPHGLINAAQYYFDKEVTQLTLPECAYLAGVINAPSSYDAFYNLEAGQERRDVVLDLMEMHGYITSEECELAKATPLENLLKKSAKDETGYYPNQAYIDAVVDEAIEVIYKDTMSEEEFEETKDSLLYDLLEQSLTIHTFMDAGLQNYIETKVITGEDSNVYITDDSMEMCGTVIDVQNGRIVGLLGGRDYIDYDIHGELSGPKIFGFNRATENRMSCGSSLKPILAYGIGIELLDWPTFGGINDEKYQTDGGTREVYNWDLSYHGVLSFAEALGSSWNVPAVKCLDYVSSQVGFDKCIEYCNNLGLTVNDAYDSNGELIKYGDFNLRYSIGAWAYGITTTQEAGAYAAVANGGNYYKPHTIDFIEYHNNDTKIIVDENITANPTRALSEASSFMIRELMLESNRLHASDFFPFIRSASSATGVTMAAKTGTAVNTDGETKGSIFAAFSPDYAITFWLGKDVGNDPIPYGNEANCHRATATCMRYLHRNGAKNTFPSQPSNVRQATVQIADSPMKACTIATEFTPDRYKATGYYKTNNGPAGATTPKVNNLSSFEVSNLEDSILKVKFGPYDPASETAELKLDSKKQSTDYKRMYGRIMYVTTIKDVNDKELFTQKSEKETIDIPFDVNQTIKVCGHYEYSIVDKLKSNEVCKTIEMTRVTLAPINPHIEVTGSSVSVNVNASYETDNITITILHSDGSYAMSPYSVTGSISTTFTGLTDDNYTIQIVETDRNNTDSQSYTDYFTISVGQAGE